MRLFSVKFYQFHPTFSSAQIVAKFQGLNRTCVRTLRLSMLFILDINVLFAPSIAQREIP